MQRLERRAIEIIARKRRHIENINCAISVHVRTPFGTNHKLVTTQDKLVQGRTVLRIYAAIAIDVTTNSAAITISALPVIRTATQGDGSIELTGRNRRTAIHALKASACRRAVDAIAVPVVITAIAIESAYRLLTPANLGTRIGALEIPARTARRAKRL